MIHEGLSRFQWQEKRRGHRPSRWLVGRGARALNHRPGSIFADSEDLGVFGVWGGAGHVRAWVCLARHDQRPASSTTRASWILVVTQHIST